jgi:hypothetical protein
MSPDVTVDAATREHQRRDRDGRMRVGPGCKRRPPAAPSGVAVLTSELSSGGLP